MKRVLSIILILGLVIGGGLFLSSKLRAAGATGKTQYKVVKAEVGDVKKTVSATGTLQPWTVVDIKSKAGGRVDALLVDTGSAVKKGQVLAKIDPTDTLLSYNTAQADIDTANAHELQNDRQYRLQVLQSQIAINNARAQLNSAIASRAAAAARLETSLSQEEAQPRLWKSSVQTSRANYNNALKQLNQIQKAAQPQERADAQSAYNQAKANMDNALANLNRQQTLMEKGFVAQQVVDSAKANYQVMAAQVQSTQAKLDTLTEGQLADLEAAQARVDQAKAQLDNAEAEEVQIATAHHAVTEARATLKQWDAQIKQVQATLDEAMADRANDEIRRLDINAGKAGVARAQASMSNAKSTLDQTTVRSPSDGVILKKYVEQGTIISSALSFAATGNDILQLGDVTRMYVDVTVDETDIANVDVGQKVDVNIEAYPGIPFDGKVTRIDPQAVVEQNVTNVHVRVEIDNSDVKFKLLKPGMNATCEFVEKERKNVVNVPSDAVRSDDQGKYIEVATGGHPAPPDPGSPPDPNVLVDAKIERRPIHESDTDPEPALEGNDTTEIKSGLKEGELVVVQTIEPTPQSAGSPFSGRMGGFSSKK